MRNFAYNTSPILLLARSTAEATPPVIRKAKDLSVHPSNQLLVAYTQKTKKELSA